MKLRFPSLLCCGLLGFSMSVGTAGAADAAAEFDGARSEWHDGFARYDYVMDEATLAITPFQRPEAEKFGVRDPAPGQRRCIVIAPKQAAAGNPWSWRGCYWDHQPQTEVELLRRGFHIAYVSANATLKPGKEWDAWYAFLTEKHGLSKKPAFVGMSRGGEYEYTWAVRHPDKVACIYADNPGGNAEVLAGLGGLVAHDVPLLHVCGSIDPLLGRVTVPIEASYVAQGGRISVMIKDGFGHHPHSLRDPKPIADFIVQSVSETPPPAPDFSAGKTTRNSFYGGANAYQSYPGEGTDITCRGPLFSPCYDRYSFELPGVEGAITVIVPEKAAEGKPWVFRAGYVGQENTVDLALLAKGFYIVTGPVSYNADGPSLAHWNAVYAHLVGHGFSKTPVVEGAGRAAGEAWGWASANGGKVAALYGENPVLRSAMVKGPLLEKLEPLARAGVPVVSVCGSLDPAYGSETQTLAARYQQWGGTMHVTVKEGVGHYPLGPDDVRTVAEWLSK